MLEVLFALFLCSIVAVAGFKFVDVLFKMFKIW